MAIVNKIIHRFVHPRFDYMDPTGELYNQIIPYNVQAYSYELRAGGDRDNPDDYIVRYVLGTGRSTYKEIAEGRGKGLENSVLIPELSKEFVLNSSNQLIKIITDLIQSQVIASSYITSDPEGNPFATKADLDNATAWYDNGQLVLPKKNDYIIVTADETHPTGTGDPQTVKYVCVGIENDKPVWDYQYIINNGNFTPEQQAAIDSGITAEKVVTYDNYADLIAQALDHLTDYNNPHRVTAEQIGLGNVDNTSDLDKPISTATQEALDSITTGIDAHIENEAIHVTPADKTKWSNKQDALKMGNHIRISNDVISVEDDLAGYDNTISQFVNKSTDELENYYTKDELSGIYKYLGEVPTYDDLPSGNVYTPDTYTELQCITSDQGEYIDTHYHPTKNTKIIAKYQVIGNIDNYIYGTDLVNESNKVAFGLAHGDILAKALFGTKSVNYALDNEIHTLIQSERGLYIDEVLIDSYPDMDNFTTISTLWLFKAQTPDTHPQDISIYSFEIYEGELLVARYIPAKRKSDDAIGMYETISEVFHTNEYYPEDYDFIPGEIAGYGNQDGSVYKVTDTGTYYMWYNHEWVLINQQIYIDDITIKKNQEGSITTVGVRTKTDTVMYDWIGTKAEWEVGRLSGDIPDDWICWITDDEEEPAGIANLAQVASSGNYNDLTNKPAYTLPDLPVDKNIKDYMLKWDHVLQALVWEELS